MDRSADPSLRSNPIPDPEPTVNGKHRTVHFLSDPKGTGDTSMAQGREPDDVMGTRPFLGPVQACPTRTEAQEDVVRIQSRSLLKHAIVVLYSISALNRQPLKYLLCISVRDPGCWQWRNLGVDDSTCILVRTDIRGSTVPETEWITPGNQLLILMMEVCSRRDHSE